MLDPRLLREKPDVVAESLRRRGIDADLDGLISLDAEQRAALNEAERLRSRQKEAGKKIAALDGAAKQKAIDEVSNLAADVKEATSRADELADRFRTSWLEIPNLVDPTAADGHSDEDNLEVKRHGDVFTEGTDHVSLGESLDIIDTERAAKVSGSRFGYLKGKGALLELSLVRWAMDHLDGAGFTPMIPPVLVREHALEGTGFFPEAREQV
ncbi:MAG TPA: serine--tRNA ligase, partial [Acidimicrobiia bacterium]